VWFYAISAGYHGDSLSQASDLKKQVNDIDNKIDREVSPIHTSSDFSCCYGYYIAGGPDTDANRDSEV